jgi:hypothetical protein
MFTPNGKKPFKSIFLFGNCRCHTMYWAPVRIFYMAFTSRNAEFYFSNLPKSSLIAHIAQAYFSQVWYNRVSLKSSEAMNRLR